jgi:hypothetical protein
MGPAPGEVRVGLDAADEVLEALVLDGARVPWRRVQRGERHGLHGEGFNLSRHLARARNMEGRRFRGLFRQRFHPPPPRRFGPNLPKGVSVHESREEHLPGER